MSILELDASVKGADRCVKRKLIDHLFNPETYRKSSDKLPHEEAGKHGAKRGGHYFWLIRQVRRLAEPTTPEWYGQLINTRERYDTACMTAYAQVLLQRFPVFDGYFAYDAPEQLDAFRDFDKRMQDMRADLDKVYALLPKVSRKSKAKAGKGVDHKSGPSEGDGNVQELDVLLDDLLAPSDENEDEDEAAPGVLEEFNHEATAEGRYDPSPPTKTGEHLVGGTQHAGSTGSISTSGGKKRAVAPADALRPKIAKVSACPIPPSHQIPPNPIPSHPDKDALFTEQPHPIPLHPKHQVMVPQQSHQSHCHDHQHMHLLRRRRG